LIEIIAYIAANNPAVAVRVRDRIFAAFSRLADKPGRGHRRPDLTPQDVRFWTVSSRWTVVYRETEGPLEIVRVLGPGRDISSILR
jgi:plasmid stabilization system protein ParE